MDKVKIAIIGAGEIGLALGKLLSARATITYWDKITDKLSSLPGDGLSLPEIVEPAAIVFLCLPSWGLKEAMLCLAPYLHSGQIIITVSKGFEAGEKLPIDFVTKIASKCLVGHLGGPMIAEELSVNKPAAAILVSKNKKVLAVGELFNDTSLLIKTSTDITGVALAGILKNIYALGAGIGEALGWGSNTRAIYLTDAVNEMIGLGKILGGKKETFVGWAGLGDFLATSLSRSSLNNELGRLIARGDDLDKKSEGSVSLPILLDLIGKKAANNFPLLIMLKKIILEKQSAEEIFKQERYL